MELGWEELTGVLFSSLFFSSSVASQTDYLSSFFSPFLLFFFAKKGETRFYPFPSLFPSGGHEEIMMAGFPVPLSFFFFFRWEMTEIHFFFSSFFPLSLPYE